MASCYGTRRFQLNTLEWKSEVWVYTVTNVRKNNCVVLPRRGERRQHAGESVQKKLKTTTLFTR